MLKLEAYSYLCFEIRVNLNIYAENKSRPFILVRLTGTWEDTDSNWRWFDRDPYPLLAKSLFFPCLPLYLSPLTLSPTWVLSLSSLFVERHRDKETSRELLFYQEKQRMHIQLDRVVWMSGFRLKPDTRSVFYWMRI